MSSPEIFISYCRRDIKWRDRLRTHLKPLEREGHFKIWDDGELTPGTNWEPEILSAISRATVAVLMVTADYLGSEFIREIEVPKIIERQSTGLHVFPVLTKSCAWEAIEWLKTMDFRPIHGKPLAKHSGNELDGQLAAIASMVLTSVHDASSTAPVQKESYRKGDLEVATLESNVDAFVEGGITTLDGFVLNSGRFLQRYLEIKRQPGVYISNVRFIVPSTNAILFAYRHNDSFKKKGKFLLDEIKHIKSTWEELVKEGTIERAEFREIDCVPTNLCAIRNGDLVLTGLYEPLALHPVGLTCSRSWFHSSDDAKVICEAYSQWFATVWDESVVIE